VGFGITSNTVSSVRRILLEKPQTLIKEFHKGFNQYSYKEQKSIPIAKQKKGT